MYNTVPGLRLNKIFFQSFILFVIFFSLSYRRGLLVDKRSEPQPSERVPYVIVYRSPFHFISHFLNNLESLVKIVCFLYMQLCQTCVGCRDSDYYTECNSFDCPVLY